MSYSFAVTGADKADAIAKANAEFDKVVESQPVHAADRAQAGAAVEAFVGLVVDDATKDVVVSVSGSVSRAYDQASGDYVDALTSASLNVSVYQANKAAA